MAAIKRRRTALTVRQLVEDYLTHQLTRPVTQVSTRHHLNQLLALYGGWQARRVGAAQMQEFLAAQQARGVMATTAHHRVRLWRTVLSWAVETGRLPASPLVGFRLHRPKARRIDPPTRAEAVRMYKVAAPHIRRVIVLGMAAGPPGYIMGATGPQGFGTADFYVAQIPCATARSVIIEHHYSHRVVNNSYLHLGVFREGAFEGVLQWGYALNPARAGKVVANTTQGQYLELNRMWLSDDAPRNSESRAISYALKFIRRACPSVAWVQSFADERCQGLGVVYQACSFLYLGFHESPFYELDGEVYHKLLVTAHLKSGKRGAYLRANLDRARKIMLRQYRYIRFLKTDWIKRLRMPILPYPKRQPD